MAAGPRGRRGAPLKRSADPADIDPSVEAGGADFPISDEEFLKFRDFFYRKIGVQFAENKRYFVDRRIAERARRTACENFRAYFALLRFEPSGVELQQLINLLTINETYFFRESYQFDALVQRILPEIAKRKAPGDPIRIWSLPCSTGEEPYSIALSVLERWEHSDRFEIEILASDIDTRVLAAAARGVYGARSLQNVGPELRARYFARHEADQYEIIPELRSSIDFGQINLSSPADMERRRDIDVVFCRNLLIYFDDDSRREAIAAIRRCLVPGGFLFLGHSESISRTSTLFTARDLGDCLVYQRPLQER